MPPSPVPGVEPEPSVPTLLTVAQMVSGPVLYVPSALRQSAPSTTSCRGPLPFVGAGIAVLSLLPHLRSGAAGSEHHRKARMSLTPPPLVNSLVTSRSPIWCCPENVPVPPSATGTQEWVP